MKQKLFLLFLSLSIVGHSFAQTCQETIESIPLNTNSPIRKIIYSPKSNELAYEIVRDGKFITIYKGKEGIEFFPSDDFSQPNRHKFSPDGKRFAYFGLIQDRIWQVVVDGKEGRTYEQVEDLTFSDNSKNFSYIAWKDNRHILVENDEEKVFNYNFISGLRYTSDGLVFHAFRFGGHDFKVINGVEMSLTCDIKGRCFWDNKGKIIARQIRYASEDGKTGWDSMAIDGHESKKYDYIGNLTFNKGRKRYAYTAASGKKLFPVIDGKESKLNLDIQSDCCGEGGHWFEVWTYGDYTFSLDDNHLAFVEGNGGISRVVLDEKYISDGDESIKSLRFSLNGKALAYVVQSSFARPKYQVVAENFKSSQFDVVSDLYPAEDSFVYFGYSQSPRELSKSTIKCQ